MGGVLDRESAKEFHFDDAGLAFIEFRKPGKSFVDGDNIEGWARYAGVWALQCSVVDTTYRGNFYLGIGIEDPTAGGLSLPCFGGGRKNRTQIYRILQGVKED